MGMRSPQGARKVTYLLLPLLINTFTPNSASAWIVKGKWSTAKFDCQGTKVEIGVDMSSKIGGGDAAPVRSAYMVIRGKKLDSAWMVGASMNSISTNNRDHYLVLGNKSIYLESIGSKRINCINI